MTQFKTLSLRQAAKFDYDNNLAAKLTGWGKVCKARTGIGVSRKDRIKARKGH